MGEIKLEMICSACRHEIHRSAAISYLGDRVRHRDRSECLLILETELADAKQRIEVLENVCGEAYQIIGALSTCTVTDCTEPLDNVLAAAQGDPIPHESVLPFRLDDDPLKRITELEAQDESVNQFSLRVRSDERRKTVEEIAAWYDEAGMTGIGNAIRVEFLEKCHAQDLQSAV